MKKLRFIAAAVLLIGTACQRENSFPEVTDMPTEASEEKVPQPAGKLLGQMVFDSITYAIQPEQMLQPFIDEFGDGTVVDHAQIRKIQATKKDKPYFYVVGIGMKNGNYRMMAIELHASEDNNLYVATNGRKYISTSEDCDFCMFTYDKNVITGAECQSRSADEPCTFKVEDHNSFMR